MSDQIELKPVDTPFKIEGEVKDTHLELFEFLADQPDNTTPISKSLLVLATPRCGSTLYCEALNGTGLLGFCDEWFNYEYFAAWMKVVGKEDFILREYVEWVERKTARDTGVFCLKWHIGQIISMNEDFNLGFESMDFSHIVYIYRRDKIAQAVSMVKAVTMNQYRSYETPTGEARMTRAAIASGIDNITKFDDFTRNYLWKYVDVSYAYEDLCRLDTPQTRAFEGYRDTLVALGKSPKGASFQVKRLKKQADHVNEAAIKDFRAYILGEIK